MRNVPNFGSDDVSNWTSEWAIMVAWRHLYTSRSVNVAAQDRKAFKVSKNFFSGKSRPFRNSVVGALTFLCMKALLNQCVINIVGHIWEVGPFRGAEGVGGKFLR